MGSASLPEEYHGEGGNSGGSCTAVAGLSVLVPSVQPEGPADQKKPSVALVFTGSKEMGLGSWSASGNITEHVFFGTQNPLFPGWCCTELQQMIIPILAPAMVQVGAVCSVLPNHTLSSGLKMHKRRCSGLMGHSRAFHGVEFQPLNPINGLLMAVFLFFQRMT